MANANDFNTVSTYEVEIDNVSYGAFTRVSGVSIDIEDLPAKNDDGKQTVNTPGSFNAGDLILVRRFNGDKALNDWMEEVKNKGNRAKKRTGSVRLLSSEGKKIAQFDFDEAWIKHWSTSDLSRDSHGNNMISETAILSVGNYTMV